jgi:hypothetical protein
MHSPLATLQFISTNYNSTIYKYKFIFIDFQPIFCSEGKRFSIGKIARRRHHRLRLQIATLPALQGLVLHAQRTGQVRIRLVTHQVHPLQGACLKKKIRKET